MRIIKSKWTLRKGRATSRWSRQSGWWAFNTEEEEEEGGGGGGGGKGHSGWDEAAWARDVRSQNSFSDLRVGPRQEGSLLFQFSSHSQRLHPADDEDWHCALAAWGKSGRPPHSRVTLVAVAEHEIRCRRNTVCLTDVQWDMIRIDSPEDPEKDPPGVE